MRPHTRTHCSRKGDCEPGGLARLGAGPGAGLARLGVGPLGLQTAHSPGRHIALVELPAEILIKILQYMNFKENSTVRLVCRRLNELCAARLNSTFQRLQSNMLVRFQTIKVRNQNMGNLF